VHTSSSGPGGVNPPPPCTCARAQTRSTQGWGRGGGSGGGGAGGVRTASLPRSALSAAIPRLRFSQSGMRNQCHGWGAEEGAIALAGKGCRLACRCLQQRLYKRLPERVEVVRLWFIESSRHQ